MVQQKMEDVMKVGYVSIVPPANVLTRQIAEAKKKSSIASLDIFLQSAVGQLKQLMSTETDTSTINEEDV